ncbi:MAG: DUF3784 domain-containing protein [Selenomonas sp.]|nr:DUF3784 domain-containing protein [Selenomonas sp.]
MILSILLVILFVILAIVFLAGKGDGLIAGYTTASEEMRQQINIRRLRLLMAGLMVLTAIYCGSLFIIGNDVFLMLKATAAFVLIAIIFIILTNTWAKKQ